jgi:hypothetical protein
MCAEHGGERHHEGSQLLRPGHALVRDALSGRRKDRRHHLKRIRQQHGRAASRRARHILDAETELAAKIAATDDPAGPDAETARAELARIRSGAAQQPSASQH